MLDGVCSPVSKIKDCQPRSVTIDESCCCLVRDKQTNNARCRTISEVANRRRTSATLVGEKMSRHVNRGG